VTQPPLPGHGKGEQPGRDAGLPGGRDPRLAAFAEDNAADRCPPGPWTGMVLNELSGPDRRCTDATDDELIGLLGRWAAQESWAVAAKLGVIRELLRRRALAGAQVRWLPGGLPDAWDEGTEHEVAGELGISLPAADSLVGLAWTLEARLPLLLLTTTGARSGQRRATPLTYLLDRDRVAEYPQLARYQALTTREVPIVVIARRGRD
jgi:hypothetical protein